MYIGIKTVSKLHISVSGWLFSEKFTRCCINVIVVAKRYIVLDVAKKHILIACKKEALRKSLLTIPIRIPICYCHSLILDSKSESVSKSILWKIPPLLTQGPQGYLHIFLPQLSPTGSSNITLLKTYLFFFLFIMRKLLCNFVKSAASKL